MSRDFEVGRNVVKSRPSVLHGANLLFSVYCQSSTVGTEFCIRVLLSYTNVMYIMILPLESRRKMSSAPSVGSPVVDRIRPQVWG